MNAIESKYGQADKRLNSPDNRDYWVDRYNEDIDAGYSSFDGLTFKVEIKGGSAFLYGCSHRDFEEQNKIDKANKKAELKNF